MTIRTETPPGSNAVAAAITDPALHTFDSITGHEVSRRYLQQAAATGALPHALLFHGPRGVGKRSMAYAFGKMAATLNARTRDDADAIARRIAAGVSADFLLVGPRGPAMQITLAGWRRDRDKDDENHPQYYRFVETRPLESARKVLVFHRAERMNVALANFLLKLIEEPPPWLIIVMLTERPAEVLPTIRSRCAPVQLSPLTLPEMTRYARSLPSVSGSADADGLIRMAEGRPGVLIEQAGQAQRIDKALAARTMTLFQDEGFLALFRAASDLVTAAGAEAGTRGAVIERTLEMIESWLRDAIVLKTSGPDASAEKLVWRGQAQTIERFAARTSLEGLVEAAETLQSYGSWAHRQTDAHYAFESFLLDVGRGLRG